MNVAQIIIDKREGRQLTREQIKYVIAGFTMGEVPDYQMSALLMAIFFRGMSDSELNWWTDEMIASGEKFDLGFINAPKVDKHSTGGVGDKVSLALAPIVAACGVYVPMISGRGLGHTGGTLDKLESFPGMNVQLKKEEFLKVLDSAGFVFAGQTEKICPADRRIYSLRDVTGTVDSIPLIASSIMSKKIAEGIDGLVLDVKVGKGAFMKDVRTARQLAGVMKKIAQMRGIKVRVVLTDMNQPLGRACGNAVEAQEAMMVLNGGGPDDLKKIVMHLSGWMVYLGGKAMSFDEAVEVCEQKVAGGEALKKMQQVLELQGSNSIYASSPDRIPVGEKSGELKAEIDGWVVSLDAYKVGMACVALGAGRKEAADAVDLGAGLILHKKEGEKVEKGQSLATLYCSDESKLLGSLKILRSAYRIEEESPSSPHKLIIEEL